MLLHPVVDEASDLAECWVEVDSARATAAERNEREGRKESDEGVLHEHPVLPTWGTGCGVVVVMDG